MDNYIIDEKVHIGYLQTETIQNLRRYHKSGSLPLQKEDSAHPLLRKPQ